MKGKERQQVEIGELRPSFYDVPLMTFLNSPEAQFLQTTWPITQSFGREASMPKMCSADLC
jgi:hypothetical protein